MADSQETAAQSLASISTSAVPATDPLLATPQKPASPKKRFRSPDPVALKNSTLFTTQATGISEMEAKRRKTGAIKDTVSTIQSSKNPAAEALNVLSAGNQATSKASEAPGKLSGTTPAIVPSFSTAEGTSSAQTSPTTAGSEGLPAALNATHVASPGPMDTEEAEDGDPGENKAFSYPGTSLNAQGDAMQRGMSLPDSNSRDTKSPASNKKHKCPYCSTEFTRHHNLKSHLLTHSHEKPYMCQTCDSRFRRLHDLKRHTKLHTGERPHVCPKCNRKFARGDALARHAKGQGGCAGRRSSVGGEYGNEEDVMEGMVYTDGQSHEPDTIDDDEAGGSSVPSIRHPSGHQSFRADSSNAFGRLGSTYPPIAAARANMGGGLHPPGSSTSSAGQYTSGPYSSGGVFPTSQMTESPKPLSPGNMHGDRDRASSMGQPYGRRGTRNTPPPSLPPVANNQLPSLSGLQPPDPRFTLHSTPGGSGPSPTLPHPASGTFPPHSASNSLSSHGTGPHGSGERAHLPYAVEDRLWAVIKSLEAKVDSQQQEISMLREEMKLMRGQPSGTQSGSGGILPPPPR